MTDKITLHRLEQIPLIINFFIDIPPLSIENNIVAMGSAVPKANTVDFGNWVLDSDLKDFISAETPIDAIQPFRSCSRTRQLKNDTIQLEH